jgi:hypothetical protein
MSEHLKHNNYERPELELPIKDSKLLLHSCCAPCAGEIMEAVAASKIDTTVYFYNPNIHPKEEYEIRKDENKRFCDKLGFGFIDADYDKDNWFERVKGLEEEPERGKRCTECFTCYLKDLRYMLKKMIIKFMLLLLVYRGGKIWIKLMILAIDLLKDMKMLCIGILTGEKKVAHLE